MKYSITVTVDQVVTKEINLIIEADDIDVAEEKAREALQDYPQPVKVEGVEKVLVLASQYYIPKSIDVKRKKKIG